MDPLPACPCLELADCLRAAELSRHAQTEGTSGLSYHSPPAGKSMLDRPSSSLYLHFFQTWAFATSVSKQHTCTEPKLCVYDLFYVFRLFCFFPTRQERAHDVLGHFLSKMFKILRNYLCLKTLASVSPSPLPDLVRKTLGSWVQVAHTALGG